MSRIVRQTLVGATAVIAVGLTAGTLPAQQAPAGAVTITGRVTSTAQAPVPGATVAVFDLRVGTTTRADGTYSFVIPPGMTTAPSVTVTARAISFKAATAQVTLTPGTVTQDFTLDVNPLQLGELVVTGEGTSLEAQKVATARSNIAAPAIEKSNEPNLVTTLSAKAPNVDVRSSAGDPGASSSIIIRGINTLGGGGDRTSQPLFVIDGVPVDNSAATTAVLDPQTGGPQGGVSSPNRAIDINPDDIASVEILKGAAAGSIYGARAGQGVILITTKKGRAGQTQYSLKSNYSVDNVVKFPRLQRLYGQGDGGSVDPTCAINPTPIGTSCSADSWGPVLTGVPTFDHRSELFGAGNSFDNTLTVSGGNERTTFFGSGSYLDQGGTVLGPNDYFKRSSVRLSANHRIVDRLRIGGDVSFAASNQGAVQKGFNFSSITWTDWLTPPDFNNLPYLSPTTGLQRSYRYPFPSALSQLDSRGYDNPFFAANTSISTSDARRTFGDVNAQYDALSWLRFNYTLGLDYTTDTRLQGQPQSNSQTFTPAGQVITLDLSHAQIDHNLTGTATYRLGSRFDGTFTLGQNLNSRSSTYQGLVGDGLLAPSPYSLSNTVSQRPPVITDQYIRDEGYFGQGTFDAFDQLFLKAGVRYDGSSAFATDRLFAWFPSASAAWEFTKVTGKLGPVGYGKLRLAYGEVGTEPDPYLNDAVFNSTLHFNDAYGGLFESAQASGGLATPSIAPAKNLGPERTKELEGGFDVGLFGATSDLNFTLYRRESYDVILAVPVAPSTGYQLQFANGASILNQGGELGLNVRPITRKGFAWEIGVLYGVNHNTVTSLFGAPFGAYGGSGGFGQVFAVVGAQANSFLDYDYVRCGRGVTLNGGVYNVDAHCTPQQRKSHALFINDGTLANNNGDPGDGAGFPLLDPTLRYVGSPNPKWSGSLRNQITAGHWVISALVDVRHGGLVYNGTHEVLNFYGTSFESGALRNTQVVFGKSFMKGAVAGPGAGSTVTLDQNWFQSYYGGISPHTIGFPFYEDGSFTKLREISLQYSLTNAGLMRRLGLSSVDLRASGRNLIVWSGYSGSDPEVNSPGAETGAQGIDFFSTPQTRSFVFTVILNR